MIKKKVLFALFLLLFSLTLISATTFDDTLIKSNGLNSTINVSNFSITFDKLVVSSSYIAFYNLTYTNPLSCALKLSNYSFYNFTELNTITELPKENCVSIPGGGGGSGGSVENITNETNITCYYISTYLNCSPKYSLYECKKYYYTTKGECLQELDKLKRQPALIRSLNLNIIYIGGQFYEAKPLLGFLILIFLIIVLIFLIRYLNKYIILKKREKEKKKREKEKR